MSNNRLFVSYKPRFVSSNQHLSWLKRRDNVKKAGFSGILDPFACGALVVAYGEYTRLFRFFKTSPKTYRATLFLGLQSDSLDIENVQAIHPFSPVTIMDIEKTFQSLLGEITYSPPRYSAKKIAGKRACDLSREGQKVDLPPITSTIFDLKLLNYSHPFITYEATVSEGTYIRSLGAIIAEKLGGAGALSHLERRAEGKFVYNSGDLNPVDYLDLPKNNYLGDPQDILLGRKLSRNMLQCQEEGSYQVRIESHLSILSITGGQIEYQANRISLC